MLPVTRLNKFRPMPPGCKHVMIERFPIEVWDQFRELCKSEGVTIKTRMIELLTDYIAINTRRM